MDIHHSTLSLLQSLDQARSEGKRIAVVPTMGNLHEGHLSLVRKARDIAGHVVATIFVNPMQFGQNEDLDKYPRTLAADTEKLVASGCHTLFAPANEEIYPDGLGTQTVVSVPTLSALHCGASRPGHFDGVTTVVCKLFNIVQPDVAVFGLKDYQQFALIRKMARDLCMRIELVGVQTCRDKNGLALSSRNGYLTDEERDRAAAIYQALCVCRDAIKAGERDYHKIESDTARALTVSGLRPEYVAICQADTLAPATPDDQHLVILLAAYMNNTRLIDNIEVTLQNPVHQE